MKQWDWNTNKKVSQLKKNVQAQMDPLLNSTSCLRNTSAPQISPYIRKYRKTAKLFTKLVLTVYQN